MSVKDALAVPASAVYKTPEGADYLLLAGSDNKAQLTKVKVGLRGKELAEIQAGLKEGDSVITVGGYALPDGTKIAVEATPAADEPDKSSGDAGANDKAGDAPPSQKAPEKGKE
jgi:membrane fusion protein, multidrug efflux system